MSKRTGRDELSVVDLSITSSERRWILGILDLLAVNGAFALAIYLRPDYELNWELIRLHPLALLLLNGLWLFFAYVFRVYDLNLAGRAAKSLIAVLKAGSLTAALFPFVPYLPPALPPSRQPLFLAILLPVLFLMVGRALYLLVFAQAIFRRRTIIVGAGWAGKTVTQAILEYGNSIYDLIGFIDDDPRKADQVIKISSGDSGLELPTAATLSVLGDRNALGDVIVQKRVTTIVLAVTKDISGELLPLMMDCLQHGVEIVPMPVIYEQLTGKVPVEHIGDNWSVSMPVEHPGTKAVWHVTKRIFDLFWASIGMIFLLLASPFIVLAIYIDSPGPVLYTQDRVGRYGRLFKLFKFRSMVTDAEKEGAVWASKNDARVTRIGRLMRKLHIDEFPQFINILKGDMSVVGPRPERPEFVKDLATEIPFFGVRHSVKPGMAGWGLINQGYGDSKEEALVKLQYDLYYIKHQSLWLDFVILGQTILDSLSLEGR